MRMVGSSAVSSVDLLASVKAMLWVEVKAEESVARKVE